MSFCRPQAKVQLLKSFITYEHMDWSVVVHIDALLKYSTVQKHFIHVEIVLSRLQEQKF